MSTKLIRLADGTLIEVEIPEEKPQKVAATAAERVEKSFNDQIKPTLEKICNSLSETWNLFNENVNIEQAEIEIGLGFELEGNVFITKGKFDSNLTVKLILKKKNQYIDD